MFAAAAGRLPALRRVSMRAFALVVLIAPCLQACSSTATPDDPTVEVVSLLGEPLRDLPLPPEARAEHEAEYAVAKARVAADPNDAEARIALGRRAGALGHVKDAIAIFERGVELFPRDARMHRHLGHRLITARRFADSEKTLERAATLVVGRPDVPEPGLKPNARGIVIDTLQQNIFYHLALARHLQGNYDGAVAAWRECMKRSTNPDSLCSCTNWLCASLLRAGRADEAKAALEKIRADLDVVEYEAYFALCRVYKGELDGDAVLATALTKGEASTDYSTVGYGVGNWHFVHGRVDRAFEVWSSVARAPMWAAFGRIGSENELARRASR
jgi:tetratricopeptide (TPR) repeat protein